MDEFTKRLTALRSSPGQAVKGAVKTMKKGLDGTASKAIEEARKKQSEEMIRKNFGNEENYRKSTENDGDLFELPYQKVGKMAGKAVKGMAKGAQSLMQRLSSLRNN